MQKSNDKLSVAIKILIGACVCMAVIVVVITVKAVSDSGKEVVPFVSDGNETVQVAEPVEDETEEETTHINVSNALVQESEQENQESTQPQQTSDEAQTYRAPVPEEDTTTAVAETTLIGLIADEDRIIVDPQQEMWNLVVVNAGRKMPAGYEPKLAEVCNSGVYMEYRVAPWYDKMYYAAKEDGITLVPYSGYRSYARQERNYNNLTETYMGRYGISRQEAAAKAATVILPPGTSEHNLGLAMDICNTYDSFATQKEYAWLVENAHKYGFILRYTAEKQPITGIVPEPWHWRYVGVEYAEKIKNSGLCLEEYLALN